MKYHFKDKLYKIIRYPITVQNSLRAWNSADEHILKYLDEKKINLNNIVIYNDRFGFLSTILANHQPKTILNFKSQEKSIYTNLKLNGLDFKSIIKINPLDKIKPACDLVLIKIPKSLDLFRLQMEQLYRASKKGTKIVCAFMTKYFSPQILDICNEYFEIYEQSKAWKKSRLILIKNKKKKKKAKLNMKLHFQTPKYLLNTLEFFLPKK